MNRCIHILKFLTLLFSGILLSQEVPPIINYSPNDYGAANQNWSISQSIDKNIYLANNDGLLEFNGAYWKLYPSPNGSIVRSVEVVGDRAVATVRFEVGSGTYIRSLAEELGRKISYPATLQNLRRIKVGKFDIEMAQQIADIK